MLRIAICDDMPQSRTAIQTLLMKWRPERGDIVTEIFDSGDTLLRAHAENPFDIILLDIVMPVPSGLETAAELRRSDRSVKLVFITLSPEYAIDSYSVHADGYLLKPLDSAKLFACLDDICMLLSEQPKYLQIRGIAAVYRVKLQSIEYVEAQGKLVLFKLSDGSTIKSTDPLYLFDEQLTADDGFLKCHRSYIVNVFRINTYTKKEVTMQTGCRIPISRGLQKEFEAAYFELMFGKVGDFL